MLWSIDKTGYPLTSITWPHHRFRNRPIEVVYFLMLSADRWLVVNWSQAQVNFLNFVWNMLCLCHYGSALLRFWCQTDLERKNLASYLKIQAGKTFFFPWSRSTSNFYPLIGQNLTVRAENLCRILKLVYFDRWSSLSTFDVFNCLSPLNDIQWHTM